MRQGTSDRWHSVQIREEGQRRPLSENVHRRRQLVDVVEASDLLRVGLADLHGAIDHLDCDMSAVAWCQSVWCADCKSCPDTPQEPISKTASKRLGIEFESVRHNFWRERGNALPKRTMLEDKPELLSDVCRWIDTTVMVAGAVAEAMKQRQ